MAKVHPAPKASTTVVTTNNTQIAVAGPDGSQASSPLVLSKSAVAVVSQIPENFKISHEQSIELQDLNARNHLSQSDRKIFASSLHGIFKTENQILLQILERAHKTMPKLIVIQDDLIENYLLIRKQFTNLIHVANKYFDINSVKKYLKLAEDVVSFTAKDLAVFNKALKTSIAASLAQLQNYEEITRKTQRLTQLEASQNTTISHKSEIDDLKRELAEDRVDKIANSGTEIFPAAPPCQLDTFDNTVQFLQAKHNKSCCSVM